jgi:hypothetical protein
VATDLPLDAEATANLIGSFIEEAHLTKSGNVLYLLLDSGIVLRLTEPTDVGQLPLGLRTLRSIPACELPAVRGVRRDRRGQPTTGTRKGFQRHREAGERPCDACQEAKDASYERQRERRREQTAERQRARAERKAAEDEAARRIETLKRAGLYDWERPVV